MVRRGGDRRIGIDRVVVDPKYGRPLIDDQRGVRFPRENRGRAAILQHE